LSSCQVLFHIHLVQGREGDELMFGMQDAVFGEPGATGGRACDVGSGASVISLVVPLSVQPDAKSISTGNTVKE
jgi:hypothetical protein